MMYDTIRLSYMNDCQKSFDLEAIKKNLVIEKEIKHKMTNQIVYNGHFNNFLASLSNTKLCLTGSIPKYLNGDNVSECQFSDYSDAIEKLSDELHLFMMEAKVTRLDFGLNIKTSFKPFTYYSLLCECSPYDRSIVKKDTLYYKSDRRTLIFYDKAKESNKKGISLEKLPENLLRYEIRFLNKLKEQFKMSVITAKTLSDKEFFSMVAERCYKEYLNLPKRREINHLPLIRSPKDIERFLSTLGLYTIGFDNMNEHLENSKNAGAICSRANFSRCKNKLKELISRKTITVDSDLIMEFDQKMKEAMLAL
jgi:hypothetical protein